MQRHALRPPPPDPASDDLSVSEFEFTWDTDEIKARNTLPTLPDEDPLRYDLDCSNEPRDTLPTLTDLDPLRYDSDVPLEAADGG